MTDHGKAVADVVAGAGIITTLMGWLPPVAAILGIVWYLLQIFSWFEKRMNRQKNFKRRATDRG